MAGDIRVTREGDVLRIALDRPERLNAAPPAMFVAIRAALSQLDGARAVLLTGEGRAFCSGADVGAVQAAEDGPAATHHALIHHYNPCLQAIADLAVPVVSAVRGAAAGIGCSLALAADFCVAADDAYFLQAFINIGLVPDGGASWMLPRLIGRARATRMMLLGERVPAATALDWGMIHDVVAADALDDAALALARRLAAGPTLAMGLSRRNLAYALDHDYAAAMAREAEAQRTAAASADAREGTTAFLAKRAPRFEGR